MGNEWRPFQTPDGADAAYIREGRKVTVTLQKIFTSQSEALQFKPVLFPIGLGLSKRARPSVADYSIEEQTAYIGPKALTFWKVKGYLEFTIPEAD